MKSERMNKILPYVFLLIVVAVLSLCFYRNQLGVCSYDWFMTYQDDSDLHIRGRITRTIETGDPFSDHGLIGQYAVINGVERFDPYFRQMGIHIICNLFQKYILFLAGAWAILTSLQQLFRKGSLLNLIWIWTAKASVNRPVNGIDHKIWLGRKM